MKFLSSLFSSDKEATALSRYWCLKGASGFNVLSQDGRTPKGQEAEEESCQEPGLSSLTDYTKLLSIQNEIEQKFTLK